MAEGEPKITKEWNDVRDLEVEVREYHYGLTEELPKSIQIPSGVNYIDVFKVTWEPSDRPQKAEEWTDDLRWAVLESTRHHVSRDVVIDAKRSLPFVKDDRFIPVLLATLMRTDRRRSYDGGRSLRPTLFRILESRHRSEVDQARKLLEGKKNASSGDWGLMAVCFAATGRLEDARRLMPESGRQYFFQGMKGAPLPAVLAVAESTWSTLPDRAKVDAFHAMLSDSFLPSEGEIPRVLRLAKDSVDVAGVMYSTWSRLVEKRVLELGPDRTYAIIDGMLETDKKNDRFPVQYVWKAGPRAWGPLNRLWTRLSSTTREAAVRDMVKHSEADADSLRFFLIQGLSGSRRQVKDSLTWIAAHADEIDDPLKEKALERAAQKGVSGSLRRKVEKALQP